jgi:hypothetical protein
MPKKIISDIILPEKSIRQIPLSEDQKVDRRRIPKPRGARKQMNPKFVIWLLAIIAVASLFFGVSLIFSSATLTVSPRVEKITFNGDSFTAKLDSTNPSELSYEVLNIEKVESQIVEATEEKVVNQKASGKIVIYNTHDTSVQRLLNNTRFEATTGKIYRIANSVDVPGTKTVAGKVVPGSIEVTVYADQPGEDYNLKLSDLKGDFKIPGFKGTPRYTTFYARLKTDIAGGLIGKQRVVSATVREKAVSEIKDQLKEGLIKELYAVKPNSYLVFPDSYLINYSVLSDAPDGDEKLKISVQGSLSSLVWNSQKAASYFGTKKIADFDKLTANFIPTENLSVTFKGSDAELTKNKSIEVKLTGEAYIKWSYDSEEIKRAVYGEPKARAADILSKYETQVKSINVLFRPVWARYFPDDLDKIKVVELDE